MRQFEYLKPKTLEEASRLLVQYGEEASVLNGGTDLLVRIRDGISRPKAVVDIKGIDRLKEISFDEEKGLTIGACVNLNDMIQYPVLVEKYRILAEAAHTVGSCQVRNRATMAGNITNASPLADTATPLLVLDAMVKVFGPQGEREVSIHDFFLWVRKTCLQAGEIVTAVRIPVYKENVIGNYQKHGRRDAVDLSTVCGAVVKIGDQVRIALGAVAPTPIRAWKTEEFLKGKNLTEDVIAEAAEIALRETAPIGDIRASKEYREEIIKVLVRRGLGSIRRD
ncbi:FAD binding domain-containing protein [Thermotalea metallivorans]|uniref:Carbon monoxide dehydrogenase medium chain n=1 Tax=Thermotalea metallivorans TaxID=520762 RepID=A0A140L131_9FIRM|nr:xanthine dehydrogenase family protein subunit M [Thermotalea metallivorans]KXG74256.1 Carbon monoxide dehydrogenase medium chain [Thermotalea metallivorans]